MNTASTIIQYWVVCPDVHRSSRKRSRPTVYDRFTTGTIWYSILSHLSSVICLHPHPRLFPSTSHRSTRRRGVLWLNKTSQEQGEGFEKPWPAALMNKLCVFMLHLRDLLANLSPWLLQVSGIILALKQKVCALVACHFLSTRHLCEAKISWHGAARWLTRAVCLSLRSATNLSPSSKCWFHSGALFPHNSPQLTWMTEDCIPAESVYLILMSVARFNACEAQAVFIEYRSHCKFI